MLNDVCNDQRNTNWERPSDGPKNQTSFRLFVLEGPGSKTVWVMQATQDNTEIADSENAVNSHQLGCWRCLTIGSKKQGMLGN